MGRCSKEAVVAVAQVNISIVTRPVIEGQQEGRPCTSDEQDEK